MKKLLFVLVLLLMPLSTKAQVYGFMDNKYYDVSENLKYLGFMNGTYYDMQEKEVWKDSFGNFTYETPKPVVWGEANYYQAATSTPVFGQSDMCLNLGGDQLTVPVGMLYQDGYCVWPRN